MINQEELKKLNPSKIAKAEMDADRILYVSYHSPIVNANKDYEVALYLTDEIAKLERANGKHLGLLIDVTNYNRLDSTGHFGITTPSLKTRQLHSKMYKESASKRVAYYRKDISFLVEAIIKMAAFYHNKKVKAFSDKKKAVKWLKEGVKK